MSDRLVVTVALAAALGAWAARPVPVVVVAVVVVVAAVARRPWLVVVAVLLLASLLGARAWAGSAPIGRAAFDGPVTLVSDPENAFGAVRVEVRAGSRRVEAWARGPGAGRLRALLAGERVHLTGRLGPPPDDAPWLVARHVVGRLDVTGVGPSTSGDPVSRLANTLRRTLQRGAADLPDQHRALFTGLVLGDDREQDGVTEDDFRGAGLTHLLAVSGQNVAFVLALAGPLLGRLGWRTRLASTLAVLGFFALLTRFEPSVLRATMMAALATTATTWGREASGRRLLALAVTALVLIDPLLVHSVGFQLSVGASAGIGLLARPLADALPGPRALRSVVAVTLAAQLGVAPVLLPVFGGIPVASVPANVLAGFAAGPVMVWGLTGGLVAGLVGPPIASVLHVPTGLLVGWIAGVARRCTALRLGEWGAVHVGALVALTAGWWRFGHRSRPWRNGVVVMALAVALHPAVVMRQAAPSQVALAPDAVLHHGRVLEIGAQVTPRRLLDALRRQSGTTLTLITATSGGARAAEAVALVRARYGDVPVVAPAGHRVPGAVAREPPWVFTAGDLVVEGERDPEGDGLVIHVR